MRASLLVLGETIVRRRVAVLCLVVLAATAFASGMAWLQVGFGVDNFFRSADPTLRAAKSHYSEQGFQPPDRILLFGWPEADPLADAALERLEAFEAAARAHEVVLSVTTLATAQVPGRLRADPEQVAASRTWRQLLVSKDRDAVGGVIVLQPGWHHTELRALCDTLSAQLAASGQEVRWCGLPYHTMESRQLVRDDMARFLPIGTAVSAVLLFWLVPHWLLALAALLVVPLTLVSTLGLMAFCGVEITMLTSTLPTLLLCMSVADGLHMVGRFLEERDGDGSGRGDARAAAARTFAAMLVPCLLTSLTTIVGFATLLRAELRDLGHLGLFAAAGMGFAFVYTMLLLPAVMSWVRSPVGRRPLDPVRWVLGAAFAAQRLSPRWWLLGAGVLSVLSGWSASGLQTEHRITADLWQDSAVMRQMTWYEQRFVGVVPAEIVVDVPGGLGATQRAQLAEFVSRIEKDPTVARTLSVVDLFADGLPPALLPAVQKSGALPPGFVAASGELVRLLVFRGDFGTKAWRRFEAAVVEDGEGLDTIRPRLAGLQMVGTALVLSMTDDLALSFLGSVVVIFVLVWLQCRRLRLAIAAMLSCLVPMLLVVGLMVLLGITLRPLTVISFCVALGLMVDDTIHLAARYDEERRRGLSPRDAVLCALRTAGRPVVVTTLVLLVGFVTILGSGFKGTFTFGLLVDLSLSFALVAALVLLPALLRALAPGKAT